MKYLLGFAALVAIAACNTESSTENNTVAEENPAPTGFMYSDVKPIFDARCVGCHGSNDPKGGLRMDSHEAIMKGGEDGAVVVAGKASDSELVHFIDGSKQPRMPFKQDPLTDEEIQKISDWIDQGAKP
jgi:mono/diheme cytochrome c family protein